MKKIKLLCFMPTSSIIMEVNEKIYMAPPRKHPQRHTISIPYMATRNTYYTHTHAPPTRPARITRTHYTHAPHHTHTLHAPHHTHTHCTHTHHTMHIICTRYQHHAYRTHHITCTSHVLHTHTQKIFKGNTAHSQLVSPFSRIPTAYNTHIIYFKFFVQ